MESSFRLSNQIKGTAWIVINKRLKDSKCRIGFTTCQFIFWQALLYLFGWSML